MMTLRKLIPMIDSKIERLMVLRHLSKEEFLEQIGNDDEAIKMYEDIHNAKFGIIHVEHSQTHRKHYGITVAFGEGISCYMSNEDFWFCTSIIKNIDWENNEFSTQNSVYLFEFEELPFDKCYTDLHLYMYNLPEFVNKEDDESKNKETE